jgi:hypothetical protein
MTFSGVGIKFSFLAPFVIVGLFVFSHMPTSAQRMGPFCSFSVNYDQSGQESIGPYIGTVRYFNFFEKDDPADDTSKNQNRYYFYFSLPVSTNEIGARAVSPIPTTILPARGDQVAVNYFENESNKGDFFDPVIIIEKCISDENGNSQWIELGMNDNSEELPAQPTGERKNALVRVTSDTADVNKMLVPALYRVVVMDKNDLPAIGGCFIQVGITKQVTGFMLYRDPAEMSVKNYSCKY